MIAKLKFFSLMLAVAFTGFCGWTQGIPTIWDGPIISYTHPAGVGTIVQDQLTPHVGVTRDLNQGLVNAYEEIAYTPNSSPTDTEWAYGLLVDYATLGYQNWEAWNGAKPLDMVGQPAVVHLISENIYLSITFTFWGGKGGGGAFTYDRSSPSAAPEPSVLALSGLSGIFVLKQFTRRKSCIRK